MIEFDEHEAAHGPSVQECVTGITYLTEEIEEWVD